MSNHDQHEARLHQLEQRLKQLEYNQRMLDVHVSALERSIVFRLLRRIGRPILDFKVKVTAWLSSSPLSRAVGRRSADAKAYARFIEHTPAEQPPSPSLPAGFCILLLLSKFRRDWLDETLKSLRSQSCSRWQLHIIHSFAPGTGLSDYLAEIAAADNRIRATQVDETARAVVALNQAVASSASDYVVHIDVGDLLDPDALTWLATQAPAEVIYSDEDRLDENGLRCHPVLKPDWSPDLLLACMYIGGVVAISRQAWVQAGGFREEAGTALDHDLLLRITDAPVKVSRIARILYHRRASEGTEFGGPSADSNFITAKLVEETIRRRGLHAEVERDGRQQNCCRIRCTPTRRVLASLIICSRSPRLLKKCLSAIRTHTSYDRREVVVVQHRDGNEAELRAVIDEFSAICVPYQGPFHFSRMNNLGVQAAHGEVLVFLNDDVEPIESSWLSLLVGQLERPDIGGVGARLLYPSGTLQHAGVVIGIGDGCGHIGRGSLNARFWPWLSMTRDVAAVTGACLAMRSALFRELGGFSDAFPVNYNDVDLCLRVRKAGFRVVFDSSAVLRHHECATRQGVVTFQEREQWYAHWADAIESGDRFYSPHLTLVDEGLSLRYSGDGEGGNGGA